MVGEGDGEVTGEDEEEDEVCLAHPLLNDD